MLAMLTKAQTLIPALSMYKQKGKVVPVHVIKLDGEKAEA